MKLTSYILTILLVSTIWACNTTNKHKSKVDVKTDSVSVVKKDSSASKTSDSTKVKTEAKDSTTEVEIDYSEVDDSTVTTVVIGGDTIKTTGKKPVKIKVKGKVSTSSKDSTSVNKTENSNKSSSDSTRIVQDKKITGIDKKSSRFPWWLLIVIIIGAGIWLYIQSRKK